MRLPIGRKLMLKIALFSRIALIHSMKMDIFDLKVTPKNCEIALFEFALLQDSLYCCCQCNIMSPKFDFISTKIGPPHANVTVIGHLN